jgi:hypothetical protein
MTDQTSRPRWRTLLFICLAGVAVAVGGIALKTLLPARYDPTPENEAATAQLTDGAITFVLLHEAGHMMINKFDLPKIGSEEDEADHFASAVLSGALDFGRPDEAETRARELGLFSAAAYFDRMHKDDVRHFRQPLWADEHGEPEQRAFNIVCMLYGRSTAEWGQLARQMGLPKQRLRSCVDDATQNHDSWRKLIVEADQKNRAVNILDGGTSVERSTGAMLQLLRPGQTTPSVLMPTTRKVGVFYNPVPDDLDPASKALALRGLALAKSGRAIPEVVEVMRLAPMPWLFNDPQHPDKAYAYKLIGDPCIRQQDSKPDDNAWWNPSTNSITYCYALLAEIEDNSRNVVANKAWPLQKAGRPSV